MSVYTLSYFEDLASQNTVTQRTEAWKEYSEEFDKLAFEEMNAIKDDHLLYGVHPFILSLFYLICICALYFVFSVALSTPLPDGR